MKKTLLISLGCLAAFAANAQVARWMFQPDYDSFEISADHKYMVTDSANISTLWTLDGQKVYSTPDKIAPFAEGYAVITARSGGELIGFIDEAGKFTALDGGKVTYEYPYFSDGLLLFKKDGEYGYYKTDGSVAKFGKMTRAYPFHNGYAPQYGNAQSFIKIKKMPCFYYANEAGGHIAFALDDKMVDEKDIAFTSGISNTGKGIVVVKNKVFWFDSKEGALNPMFLGDGDDRSTQATADKRLIAKFEEPSDGDITIAINYGKDKVAKFRFDQQLVPIEYTIDDEVVALQAPKTEAEALASPLSRDGQAAPYGIALNGTPLIEPQYQEVTATFGDNAIVKVNGKWGLVEIIAVPTITTKLNNNHELAFRHNEAKSELCITLPAAFPAKGLKVKADTTSGMTLIPTSREDKDSPDGNTVIYDVELSIPQGLTTEATTITYPLHLTYEGAELPEQDVDLEAWFVNYFTVDPLDFGTRIDNGNVTVAFDVDRHDASNEAVYPIEVKVIVGQTVLKPNKVSETRYKITLPNVPAGMHHIDIAVIEQGCPAQLFPFDLEYNPGDTAEHVAATAKLLLADPLPLVPVQNQFAMQPMQTMYPVQQMQQYVAQPVQQYQQYQAQPMQYQAQPMQYQAQPVQQYQAQPVQQYQAQQVQQYQAQPVQQYQAQPVQQYQAQPVVQQYQAQPVQQYQAQPVQQYQAQPVQYQAQPVQYQAQPVQYQAQPVQQYQAQPVQQANMWNTQAVAQQTAYMW